MNLKIKVALPLYTNKTFYTDSDMYLNEYKIKIIYFIFQSMKTNEMRGSIRSTPLPEISPFETSIARNNKVFTVTKSAMACSTLSACPA